MVTDGAYGYVWDRQLKSNAEKNVNTYAYVHSFLSSNASTFIPPWMGAYTSTIVMWLLSYFGRLDASAVL